MTTYKLHNVGMLLQRSIKLRRSRDCISFSSFGFFGSFSATNYDLMLCRLTHCQHNESVHRNEQLATRSKTNVHYIHVYFCEATDSMQYRPPNAYQEVSLGDENEIKKAKNERRIQSIT